jgi:transcriptional regulator with XRE-family HTH domain
VPNRTDKPINRALPEVLKDRRKSLRWLADELGIDNSHLSRALRGADGKRLSPELLQRIIRRLDLPPDYFVESRQAQIAEVLRRDPRILNQIYDNLKRRHEL